MYTEREEVQVGLGYFRVSSFYLIYLCRIKIVADNSVKKKEKAKEDGLNGPHFQNQLLPLCVIGGNDGKGILAINLNANLHAP